MDREIRAYSKAANSIRERLRKDVDGRIASLSLAPGEIYSNLIISPLDPKNLGLYFSQSKTIAINESIISMEYRSVLSVALHEAAHGIVFHLGIENGHDRAFKEMCKRLGVEDGYEKAHTVVISRKRLIEKVKKLEALASSPFEAEAQSALLKARKLVAENNLFAPEEEESSERIYETDLVAARAISAVSKSLARMASHITGSFIVLVRLGNRRSALRAYGSIDEVEVTTYLFDTLEHSINKELKARRKADTNGTYKGMSGAASFTIGVEDALKERYATHEHISEEKAIRVIAKNNESLAKGLVFGKRGFSRSHSRFRRRKYAYSSGVSYGSKLNIKRGIKRDKGALGIGYDKS